MQQTLTAVGGRALEAGNITRDWAAAFTRRITDKPDQFNWLIKQNWKEEFVVEHEPSETEAAIPKTVSLLQYQWELSFRLTKKSEEAPPIKRNEKPKDVKWNKNNSI